MQLFLWFPLIHLWDYKPKSKSTFWQTQVTTESRSWFRVEGPSNDPLHRYELICWLLLWILRATINIIVEIKTIKTTSSVFTSFMSNDRFDTSHIFFWPSSSFFLFIPLPPFSLYFLSVLLSPPCQAETKMLLTMIYIFLISSPVRS